MIIFDSAHLAVNRSKFGRGILPPARQWASDGEWAAHREATTFSAAEWAEMRAEAEAASLDRYHREASAEAQEMAEMGISDEAIERAAMDAAEMDRMMGWDFGPAPAEVRVIQVRGRRYVAETIASQDEDVPFAVRLTSDRGDVYDVCRHADGRIACTCPDHVWKREGLTGEPCKHGRALAGYGLLGDAPKPARKPRPVTLHQKARARRLAMA